jgi:hypothetical protein
MIALKLAISEPAIDSLRELAQRVCLIWIVRKSLATRAGL